MRNSALWTEYQHATMMYSKKDKVFVVWEYRDGSAHLVAVLVTEKPHVDFDTGLTLEMHDLVSDRRLLIDQRPAQIVEGVYAWIPTYIELRFAPRKQNDHYAPRILTVPFCVKTATHPTKALTPGHRYISTQTDFESRWPNFK